MTDISQNINYNQGSDRGSEKKKKGRKWIIIGSIILFIIVVRLLLPVFVLKYVNKTLAKSERHPGSVQDVDLAIIRGAYVIKEIRINTRDTVSGQIDSIPFFTAEAVDLNVEWRALFKGKIVGEVFVEKPRLNFVKSKEVDPVKSEAEDTTDIRQTIRDLMPLRINRFEINNGRVHYIDKTIKPGVDVYIRDIQVVAENFTNVNDSSSALPASIDASANVYGGALDMFIKLAPLKKDPTFDLTTELKDVDMVELNHFFRAYGNFDVHAGKFGLYTEVAAKEGKFKGYVKPLIRELDVVKISEEKGGFGQLLWEGVVGTVAEIFENQQKEQLGTKVPLEGTFKNPDAGLWKAVSYVLYNAFVQALKPQIDQTINIGKVDEVGKEDKEDKTFLQKIFGKDKDKEEKKAQ